MLLGKDYCWCKEGYLLTGHYSLEGGTEGDFCLSIAYVSAYQTVHAFVTFHVLLDLFNALQLVWSLCKGEGSFKGDLPVIILLEGETLSVLTLCI